MSSSQSRNLYEMTDIIRQKFCRGFLETDYDKYYNILREENSHPN